MLIMRVGGVGVPHGGQWWPPTTSLLPGTMDRSPDTPRTKSWLITSVQLSPVRRRRREMRKRKNKEKERERIYAMRERERERQ